MREFYIAVENTYPYDSESIFGWTENQFVMRQVQLHYIGPSNISIKIFSCENLMELSNYIYSEYDCSVNAVAGYHLSIHYSYDNRFWVITPDMYNEVFTTSAVNTEQMYDAVGHILLKYAPFDKYINNGLLDMCMTGYLYIQSKCDFDPVYLLRMLYTTEYTGISELPFRRNDVNVTRIDDLILCTLGSIVMGIS